MTKPTLESILTTIGTEKRIHYNLDRFRKALDSLGQPEKTVKTIVIGGTNGKGSTALLVSAGLCQAGYRTFTYLSPHLSSPTERFLNQLVPLSQEEADTLARDLESTAKKYDLTYFEFLTLLCFVWARTHRPDFLVLEVGLGGKLDATNVTDPIACAITNIGLDHQAFLGNTHAEILADKLQIIPKEGLVFSGIEESALLSQLEKHCADLDAIYYLSKELPLKQQVVSWSGQTATINQYAFRLNNPSIGTLKNAALALLLLRICFPKFSISTWQNAFSSVVFPGRFELVSENPRIILSGDHNFEGVESLLQSLSTLDTGDIHTLCGFSLDKPYLKMHQTLQTLSKNILVTKAFDYPVPIPQDYKSMGKYVEKAHDAIEELKSRMNTQDTLLITGSLYLVGRLRTLFKSELSYRKPSARRIGPNLGFAIPQTL